MAAGQQRESQPRSGALIRIDLDEVKSASGVGQGKKLSDELTLVAQRQDKFRIRGEGIDDARQRRLAADAHERFVQMARQFSQAGSRSGNGQADSQTHYSTRW